MARRMQLQQVCGGDSQRAPQASVGVVMTGKVVTENNGDKKRLLDDLPTVLAGTL